MATFSHGVGLSKVKTFEMFKFMRCSEVFIVCLPIIIIILIIIIIIIITT